VCCVKSSHVVNFVINLTRYEAKNAIYNLMAESKKLLHVLLLLLIYFMQLKLKWLWLSLGVLS